MDESAGSSVPRVEDRTESRSPASVVLVTHDEASRLRVRHVVQAMVDDPAGPNEIILVDNAMSEEGRDLASELGVRWLGRSGGFSDGCNDGVAASTEPVAVLLGHDTVPEPGWLPPLLDALEEPGVGAVIPTIEEGARKGTFNTSGGHLTFLGLAWVSDHGEPIPDGGAPVVVDFPCGGAMAMQREMWDRFHGFRPHYFLYGEDSDLGWRLRLAGLRTLRVPESRVVHEYEFGRMPKKMFLLERNRLITVLTNYRPLTLALLAPVLVLAELAVTLVALRDRWLLEKLRAWRSVLTNPQWLTEGRQLVEMNRSIGDGAMLRTLRHEVSTVTGIKAPPGRRAADLFLGVYKGSVALLVGVVDRLRFGLVER